MLSFTFFIVVPPYYFKDKNSVSVELNIRKAELDVKPEKPIRKTASGPSAIVAYYSSSTISLYPCSLFITNGKAEVIRRRIARLSVTAEIGRLKNSIKFPLDIRSA